MTVSPFRVTTLTRLFVLKKVFLVVQFIEPLIEGQYYHIYNRGINGCDIFPEDKNFDYFLKLYSKHITETIETFAYCLLRNHFHLLIRVKTQEELGKKPDP